MHRRILLFLLLLGFFIEAAAARRASDALVTKNIPEAPAALRQQLLQYQNIRTARLGGWPADGEGLYVVTGFGETPQVHFVETPGGARRQLTFFNEPIGQIEPSPADANLIAFTRDVGGDENFQVYLFDRDTGLSTRLSDGTGRAGAVAWSRDGEKIAWYATRKGSERDIVVASVKNPAQRRTAFTGEGWWSPAAWSPDGRRLLLLNFISINESYLYLLDLATGAKTQINPSDDQIGYGDYVFSPDGKSIYFTSDENGEFLNLYRYTIATGKKKNLTRNIRWDIEDVEIAPSGKTYAFVVNEGGKATLHFRTRFDRRIRAPVLPTGAVANMRFSPDGRWLAFTMDAAAAPGDVFAVRVSRRLKQIERWTRSEIGGLDPGHFIAPEFFSYPTTDIVNRRRRKIPAFIYRPRGDGPHPVVIAIHGGPESQARPSFSAQYQFWASELGVAVIRPNVRGSSGYGKSYLKLDNGAKRENAVEDIGALMDWIETQPDLDAKKVVVHGASYGGFMVLASMVRFGERLAGGVDIFGISNFVTFLENTADYRRDLRRAEYGDERDPEMRAFLERISPLNHADQISKPILIAQGLNDPRVPATESEQIFIAVRANGGEPWYMLAKDEGHGFKKKSNRDALTEATALFFAKIFGLAISGGDGVAAIN